MEAEEETVEGLLKWAAELGISDSPMQNNEKPKSCLGHSLAVSHFANAGGRGLSAVRDIRKGELVLRVPKSALLTRESLLKDDKLSFAVNAHCPFLSPTQILAVCLLYEMGKGKSSRWYPYFLHLPRSYDVMASFSECEKQALQVDDAIWTTEKAISKVESEWKDATSLMQELKLKPQLLTFKAWIWACATISSRTLHIPWDAAGCLCPVGDLFNYAAPGEESKEIENVESLMHASSLQDSSVLNQDTAHNLIGEQLDAHSQRFTDGGFNEDVAAYCFYARKNYKKGEQVLLSYGTYTNLELLEHYGFLLNENPNEKVFIPLEPSMYSFNSWPKESMYIHQDGKPSFALSSALRLWATPPNQRRSIGHLAYSGFQLSVDNEITVMEWILKNCHRILNDLPTAIELDGLLLSTIDKIQNFHNPVELGRVLYTFGGEVSAFLEANNLGRGKNGAEELLDKNKGSMNRWKLSVQWRFRYKKALVDCISYCTEIINSLSNQKVLTMTTK